MKRALLALCCALLTACASSGDSSPSPLSGTETGNPPTRGTCEGVKCTPCPPPITLLLTDAARGGPVASVVVDGDAEVCAVEAERTVCTLEGETYSALGPHELRIEAPGHEPTIVELELAQNPLWQCCPCSYSAVREEISVVPSSL